MSKIFIFPPLVDQSDVNTVVSRLAWYFKPYLEKIEAIHLSASQHQVDAAVLGKHIDPIVGRALPDVKRKIVALNSADFEKSILRVDPVRDVLLIWDVRAEESASSAVRDAIKLLTPKSGLYRVDSARTRMEGSFYLWAGLNRYSDKESLLRQNHQRMLRMVDEVGHHQKAYVFGSGPTLSDFVDGHDFSDGVCIISNSIVKNRDIVERTNPRVITAGDPLYHAGCSSYAAAFREELVSTLRETGAWFVCPMRDFAVYDAFFPEELRERIIGVPFDKDSPPPSDLAVTFYLKPYPNVLTLALLPIAATLADSIEIVGCDGRKLTDDSFFWAHDKKAQFNDKMSEIQEVHPAFFAIDYNDYYMDHCRGVEEVLSALEAAGKKLITATPSVIPALHACELSEIEYRPVADIAVMGMIDPDAKDDWGHFLAYDKRIAEACANVGVDTVVICRKELDARFTPKYASSLIGAFTVNSWTVGNKNPANLADVMLFAKELDTAIASLEKQYPTGTIVLFMYIGSIEIAEALEHLLLHRPRVRAVINLFWSYNFDQDNPKYKKLWLNATRRLAHSTQIRLTHSTDQIAKEFRQTWGVDLPVLLHPSTTFSDSEATALVGAELTRPSGKELRVVFPGGTRREKGFLLGVETANKLASADGLRPVLRGRIDGVSGKELSDALAGVDRDIVEVLDQDMSDAEFIDMIRTADIVVLPYLTEAFRRRTSGIVVDAFLLGKPVVVLENTWLADVVENSRIGACSQPNADALVAAIQIVASDYSGYQAGIEKLRQKYLSTNSWNTLVESVLKLANVPARTTVPKFSPSEVKVFKLAGDLLLNPAKAIWRIENDQDTKAMVANFRVSGDFQPQLADHFEKCLAHARRKMSLTA